MGHFVLQHVSSISLGSPFAHRALDQQLRFLRSDEVDEGVPKVCSKLDVPGQVEEVVPAMFKKRLDLHWTLHAMVSLAPNPSSSMVAMTSQQAAQIPKHEQPQILQSFVGFGLRVLPAPQCAIASEVVQVLLFCMGCFPPSVGCLVCDAAVAAAPSHLLMTCHPPSLMNDNQEYY